ncbi:cell division protein FtsQ/DivIB [Antarcticimicrobium luteum]|uniref:Cell division protein FtsQ n=1 Tax=Antarcticimicrobium luteum TaxID=2547397 RepID=A0A4R5UVD3_9RHOB|nr:cell division protein FtsQ/DivIB [Antarcticimicrobium luteum]TDK43210.1 FtsQ-type POTRA domain-containing protein [Antarcticimicrobium luteum]
MQPVGGVTRPHPHARAHARPDPAPSRLKYRMQRWLLTPGIRLGLRVGVPFCLCFALGSAFMADPQRRDALTLFMSDLRASIQERPEFMVGLMAIDGAGRNLSEDIREAVALDFPVSSFDLDLEQIRQRIIELDPVETAAVRIRPGGILQVDVTERQPAVVWRSRSGLSMLDETGAHVDNLVSRTARPELPLIAGQGADRAVAEALRLIGAARPLADRLRGLVRVGERRWDVVLDRGQRILLPPDKPVRALERVLALNEVRDLLERDVTVVDMRLRARPTVRMTGAAVEDWWKIRRINGYGQ